MKELDKKIARQSQSGSAAMARFVYSIHLFWGGIYFAGCALIGGAKRRHLYIYKGTPCAHLFKKAVFCRVLSCLIV
jgi:hypothetical protein